MNTQHFQWITNVADTGVILPLAALLVLLLWRLESGRAAWVFARALLACLVAMAVLKLLFLSCGHAMGSAIRSPSGHTSLASFFYGACAILVWARRPGWIGVVALCGALALAIAVAVSRIQLGAHNLPEVIVGGLIGTLAAVGLALPYLHLPRPRLHVRRIVLVLLPVFLLSYGTILPAERMLRGFVPFFSIGICKA